MRQLLVGLTLIVLAGASMPASAHLFNHQDRHEVCDLYGAPQLHGLHDGHAHWHHLGPVGAHMHGGVVFGESHTHADVFHDPCDQAGMLAYSFPDAPAYVEPPITQSALEKRVPGQVDVVLRDVRETARLPVVGLTVQETLTVNGDAGLTRFPGSGTLLDPYVIEGYHIRHALTIKDTTKCVVVRNNVVYNDAFRGPLVDPNKVIDLDKLARSLEETVAMLLAQLAAAQAELDAYQPTFGPLEAQHADLLATSALMQAEWEELLLILEGETWALADLEERTLATMASIGDTRDLLAAELAEQGLQLPPTPVGLAPLDPAFTGFIDDVASKAAAAVQTDEIDALRKQLDVYASRYNDQKALLVRQHEIVAEAQTEVDEFEPGWVQFQADRDAWLADVWAPASATNAALTAEVDDLTAYVTAAQLQLADVLTRLADHAFEYLGRAFDTLLDLVEHVLGELPAADPALAGRLVLDWNGQCVHVYHNLIQDLRVNQNNARTGYATGGLIENNRILNVGQIRHFDGEFRENEVGDRLYIERYVAGTQTPPPTNDTGDFYPEGSQAGGPSLLAIRPGRVINADGFNEAWMHHNVIYGSVDLDFHGHHHGPGFFARESHYHGDLFHHAYMANASTQACQYTYPTPPGPLAPLGLDEPLPLVTPTPGCLPHHDHAKRWTSVRFEDNVILDPLGYGLRYEDQNHAADDRFAASESMEELDVPHFHRTHVALRDNLVMGSVWVDVFNADGIELWSDDHSPVRRDLNGAIAGLVDHPGAHIVDSHPHRNNGWLDVTGNAVFVVDRPSEIRVGHDAWSAFQLADGKEIDKLDLSGNRAFLVPGRFDAGIATAAAFRETFLGLSAMEPRAAFDVIRSWEGESYARPASHGVLLRDVADSAVRVCGNAMLGFDRGLEATDAIRPDVGFLDCGDNDWGGAAPWSVAYTPYPPREPRLLDPVRGLGDGTPAQGHVHSLHDHATMFADP